MTSRKMLCIPIIGLGACLLTTQALATAISDATIQYATGGVNTAVASAQGQGNFNLADISMLTGLLPGEAWTLLDKTNGRATPFNDMIFLLADAMDKRPGEWRLSWDGADFPVYMDYVLVAKSGKHWGAYLFESASLVVDPQYVSISSDDSWLHKNENVGQRRHASIFGRIGSVRTGSKDPAIDRPVAPDPNTVPIPGTLALLAMGMGMGLGLGLRQLRWKC